VDELVVKKNLQNHLETEMAMLEHIEKQTKETNDDGIRLLLEHIAADEKKHHKILETVIKQSYKIKP
jgi:rubrerythrin